MENTNDTYKTLGKPSEEVLFKEKKSKFYGYAYPIETEAEVKPIIESLKKKHHTANHVCYAWQIGIEQLSYRANDDGEPNNSAGMPIYGQIQSFEVTNTLVAVARIFGGTKLGVGGLISAYKTAAKMALENADIIQKIVQEQFKLKFEYAQMDVVMRVIKQKNLQIVSQKMEMQCELVISVRKQDVAQVKEIFVGIYGVELT
ncbi:IMPACT family protein [Zobellia galactanivorans]|uniref:Protein IMPACT homolog n=1 Tax=Zobellia galactanivorans (strain DSM 12802 / CCUG 47099 / CIP 106680 / NCIMB 13871 / Dsij) TaxID=63186 RepID=G0L4V0_ZOBGA|nr:YigZ family protein [Zobellia galactanivorans]CAZ98917.1 Protein IMPACT homolog [Zobellia galactanivorans]